MQWIMFSVLIVILLYLLVEAHSLKEVIVTTKQGRIRGFQEEALKQKANIFLGVPYATPKRFQFSQLLSTYPRLVDATRFGPMCPQPTSTEKIYNTVQSEDCLRLNIYTPAYIKKPKLPVMVYFHGGSLQSGHGNIRPNAAIEQFTARGVILVTIQYRLGFLGFFSINHLLKPGASNGSRIQSNVGISDQINALKWIQKNIESFNGDPSSVTLFGDSAGACSISALMLLQYDKIYFHRVILQSGTAELCFDGSYGYFDQSVKLAKSMCNVDVRTITRRDRERLENCLLHISSARVMKEFESSNIFGWFLTVDSVFLTDIPSEMIGNRRRTPQLRKTEILLGITQDEWALYEKSIVDLKLKYLNGTFYNKFALLESVRRALAFRTSPNELTAIKRELTKFYHLDDIPANNVNRWMQATIDLFSDATFVSQVVKEALRYEQLGNKVFLYDMDQPGPKKFFPFKVAMHGDDKRFLFNTKGYDDRVSEHLAVLWTDFAAGKGDLQPLDDHKWNYVEISNNGTRKRENFRLLAREWANPRNVFYNKFPRKASERAWMTPSVIDLRRKRS